MTEMTSSLPLYPAALLTRSCSGKVVPCYMEYRTSPRWAEHRSGRQGGSFTSGGKEVGVERLGQFVAGSDEAHADGADADVEPIGDHLLVDTTRHPTE